MMGAMGMLGATGATGTGVTRVMGDVWSMEEKKDRENVWFV